MWPGTKRYIGQLDLFLVWIKLKNTKRSGRHIRGHIERIKLCGADHRSISRWSLKKAESIKGEIDKKMHKSENKEEENCDEIRKGKQRY